MANKVEEGKDKEKVEEGCCKEDWDKMEWKKHWREHHHHHGHGGSGAIYGLGLVGALIYFLGQASNFEAGLIGVLKALVWPAYLSFYALKFFLH
jgi:hypothetical protein